MTNITIPDLIAIPAGSFQLGSPPSDPLANNNEKTLEQINLPFFQISKYPITNAEYALFIENSNHQPPTYWQGKTPPLHLSNHPIVHVSLIDALSYCGWLGQQMGIEFAVPTEMEWEKAARGVTDIRRYVWGNIWKPKVCNTSELGIGRTTEVSQFEEVNVSPFGVVDLLGNVWEWTKSDYTQLPGSTHESVRFGTSYKVVRGGSWHNDQTLARIACRGRYLPGTKRDYLGFRVVTHAFINTDPVESPPVPINKEKLRENIINSFTREELRTLCFDMNINPELFPENIIGFARELIIHCEKNNLLTNLIDKLRIERPHIDW